VPIKAKRSVSALGIRRDVADLVDAEKLDPPEQLEGPALAGCQRILRDPSAAAASSIAR
jgi:hypothetical protein